VQMLPAVAVLLEGMCVGVVREVLVALLGACGVDALQRARSSTDPAGGKNGGSARSTPPAAAKLGRKLGRLLGGGGGSGSPARAASAVATDSPLRGSTSMGGGGGRPYSPLARETVLLNSLRRLLLKLPQLEAVLAKWCGGYGLPGVGGVGSLLRQRGPGKPHAGGDEDNQCLPRFSAQFRQLMTELRSDYGAAVRSAADRLAAAVVAIAPDCLEEALTSGTPRDRHEAHASAAADLLAPLLRSAGAALTALLKAVDERVLVALARGLWDHMAAKLCATVEQLQSGAKAKQDAGLWRVHLNASASLDAADDFFKQFLSSTLGSELQAKDLEAPPNGEAAHRLLANGKPLLDQSYSVF